MVNTPSFVTVPTFGSSAAKTQPPGATYSGGYLPGQVFPAEHENWFMAGLTENGNTEQTSVVSVIDELKTILTAAGIIPNGALTDQVYAALNDLYATVGDLATTDAAVALKAPLASPTFTGTVVVPVASGATSPTQKTYVDSGLASKPAIPISSSGIGQVTTLGALTSSAVVLPAGGQWMWFGCAFPTTYAAIFVLPQCGVGSGGATVYTTDSTHTFQGFCWRIS